MITTVRGQYIYKISAAKNDSIVSKQIPLLYKQINLLKETEHVDTLGIAYYLLSDRYYKNLNNIDSALFYSTLAETIWERINFSSERRVFNFYNTIKYYEANNQLNSLVSYYINNHKNIDPHQKINVYAVALKKTLVALQKLGDNETAIRILKHFLDIEKDENKLIKQLSDLYLEKGKIESALNQMDAAKVSYDLGIEYENKLSKKQKSVQRWSNIINQQFLFLLENKQTEEAFQIVNNQLSKIESSKEIALLCTNLGYQLILNKQYDEALYYTRRGYLAGLKLDSSEYTNKASFTQNYAEALMEVDSLDKAIRMINVSFNFALNGMQPICDSILGSSDERLILNILYEKTRIVHKYSRNLNHQHYQDSVFIFLKVLDTLNQHILDAQLFENSVISLQDDVSKIYRLAADVYFEYQDWTNFIDVAEKNRNLLLLKNLIRENDSDLFDSLSLLEKQEIELKYSLTQEKDDSLKATLINLQNEIISLKLKSIRDKSTVDIIQLQQVMDISKDQNVIYFQNGLESVYSVFISNGIFEGRVVSNIDDLNLILGKYIPQLHDKSNVFDKLLSQELFKKLIPYEIAFDANILVIPEEQLNYLPFESLILPNGKYLLEKTSISYTSSLSLYQYLEKRKTNQVKTIQIISPDYKEMQMNDRLNSSTKGVMTFNYLFHSKKEVEAISRMLPTSIADGIDIDKALIIDQITTANSIHFTGHAVMIPGKDQLSFLALESDVSNMENILTMAEISKLDINAEMIFMNACNTGNGSFLEGEGVYDLSRAFLTAGSKSVISSMWEIDDQSSSEITTSFYEQIRKGKSKSNALRLAKLNYLDNVTSDRERHPYYWAGLVAIGNMDPIQFSSNSSLFWIGGAILLLILLFTSQIRKLFN